MRNLLIIQTAFIGDVILATSLVEEARNKFPDCNIYFMCRKGNENLLEDNPNIKEVLIWDKKNKLPSLLKNLKKVRSVGFDQIVNLQRYFLTGLFTVLSGAKSKLGFSNNPLSIFFDFKIPHELPQKVDEEFLHEVEKNSRLFNLGNPYYRLKPKLYFGTEIQEKMNDFCDSPYFVLAPCSVWKTKQWPKENWLDLISSLSDNFQKSKIFLIGSPQERNYLDEFILSENVINLAGSLSLRESAFLMSRAERVFVNDSGPMHLASSVNAPTTAFFCSTLPSFGYGPLSDDSIILEVSDLNCRPCGSHGKTSCPLLHFDCGKKISINSALDTVKI